MIDQVVWNEDNTLPGPYAVVVGRCGDVPIRKGDVLHAAYRYKPGRYPEEMADTPVRLDQMAVRLEVAEIQTHNRSLELLGQGMTGALFVRGDGLDRLAPGWVIGQPAAATAFPGGAGVAPDVASMTPKP
jgi:hypothetical protein